MQTNFNNKWKPLIFIIQNQENTTFKKTYIIFKGY